MKLAHYAVLSMTAIMSCSLVDGFTTSHHGSSFLGRPQAGVSMRRGRPNKNRGTMLMFEPLFPDKKENEGITNMLSALESTERWISETLSSSVGFQGTVENPYACKEVSYVCEMSKQDAMIVAGIFRRLREAREVGESHGHFQEDLIWEQDETYSPREMYLTQVVVLASSDALADSFMLFDNIIQHINKARLNARDYLTDHVSEQLDRDNQAPLGERDWVVNVNCAHWHPKFGQEASERDVLEEIPQNEQGIIMFDDFADCQEETKEDPEENQGATRRSPYPTVVMEVTAMPPPQYGESTPLSMIKKIEKYEVTTDDVIKLEALLAKSAATEHPTFIVSEKVIMHPIQWAQEWLNQHVASFDSGKANFTATEVTHVDDAHEFVFTNLGKHETHLAHGSKQTRQYMVMTNFCTASATSFGNFAAQVEKIVSALPSLEGRIKITTYHPEHVDTHKRSPLPILAVDWESSGPNDEAQSGWMKQGLRTLSQCLLPELPTDTGDS